MGAVFVLVQFAALGGILLTGPLLPENPVLLAVELAGLALVAWAMLTMGLGKFGALPEPRVGTPLVTRGPYAAIRHPMYTGLLLFSLPLVLAAPSPLRIGFWLMLLVDLLLKLHYEERLLAAKFPEYAAYRKRTWKLVPGVY